MIEYSICRNGSEHSLLGEVDSDHTRVLLLSCIDLDYLRLSDIEVSSAIEYKSFLISFGLDGDSTGSEDTDKLYKLLAETALGDIGADSRRFLNEENYSRFLDIVTHHQEYNPDSKIYELINQQLKERCKNK